MSTRQELLESRRLERLQNEARGYIPAVTLNKPVETFKSKSQPYVFLFLIVEFFWNFFT